MSQQAALCLLIFTGYLVTILTNRISLTTATLIACAAMVLSGAASFSDVFGQFASSSVILVASMMVIGKAMFQSGLAAYVEKLLQLFSKGSERRLLFISMLIAGVMSAFFYNVATFALFMIILGNMRQVRLKNLILPVSIATTIGGTMTLIGSGPQLW